MNTEGIIRTSELVITLLPYRDEFILVNEIRHTAQGNMYGKRFKELGYDFDEWQTSGVTTSVEWITQQLVNGNIVRHTRSILNTQTGKNDEYYVLTKTGRRMKGENGLGTFEKLHQWREKKKKDKQFKKLQEAKILQYQTDLHPIMKIANESSIEANNLSRTTNTLIAIFTAFAGSWYLYDLLYRIASEDIIVRHLSRIIPHYKNLKFSVCFLITVVTISSIYLQLHRASIAQRQKEEV